jgi:hypothetical protein
MTGRVVWRVLMALLGLYVLGLSIWLSAKGFRGALSPWLSGLGWAFAAYCAFWEAADDTLKVISVITDKINSSH